MKIKCESCNKLRDEKDIVWDLEEDMEDGTNKTYFIDDWKQWLEICHQYKENPNKIIAFRFNNGYEHIFNIKYIGKYPHKEK